MSTNFPNIKVIEREAKWDPAVATTQMETIFSAENVDGVVLSSDSAYVNATVATLKKLGQPVPVGQPGHVYVNAINGTPPALDALRDGSIDTIFEQPVQQIAKYAISYIKDALAGKELKLGATDHGSVVVEDQNGTYADFLPPTVVTKLNVDSSERWENNAVSAQ